MSLNFFSDDGQIFTLKLVKKYAWLKAEMTLELAQKIAKEMLQPHNVDELETYSYSRRTYVGRMLKQVRQ